MKKFIKDSITFLFERYGKLVGFSMTVVAIIYIAYVVIYKQVPQSTLATFFVTFMYSSGVIMYYQDADRLYRATVVVAKGTVALCSALASVCVCVNAISDGFQLFGNLVKFSVGGTVFVAIAIIFIKKLFALCKKAFLRIKTFFRNRRPVVNSRKREKRQKAFDRFVGNVSKLSGLFKTLIALVIFIMAMASADKFETIFEWFTKLI